MSFLDNVGNFFSKQVLPSVGKGLNGIGSAIGNEVHQLPQQIGGFAQGIQQADRGISLTPRNPTTFVQNLPGVTRNVTLPYLQNRFIKPAQEAAYNAPALFAHPLVAAYQKAQQVSLASPHPLPAYNPNPGKALMGAVQTFGNFVAPEVGTIFSAFDALKGGINAARTGGNIQQGAQDAFTGKRTVQLGTSLLGKQAGTVTPEGVLNSAEFVGPLLHGKVGNLAAAVKKGIPGLALRDVSPNAFKIHPDDQAVLKGYVTRIMNRGQENVHPLDANELKDLQRFSDHYLGEKFRAATTKNIGQVFDNVFAMQNGGIPGKMPKMGFVQTPKIESALHDALAGASNSHEEAQIIHEFTDNAIKSGQNLPAVRAALNKELEGVVGNQGSYTKNFAMRQTLKDSPDVGPRINALEDSVAKIDGKYIAPGNVPKTGSASEAPLLAPESPIIDRNRPVNQGGAVIPPETPPTAPGAAKPTQTATSGLGKIGAPAVAEDTRSIIQAVKDKANQLYAESVDRFHPISQVAKQAGEDQAMRNAMTQHYGAGSTANYHVDFQLAPIVKGTNADDLRAYTIAQRDLELAQRGVKGSESGAAQSVIDGLKTKYGGNLAHLEQAAQKLYDYQDSLVKTYLVDSGVISKEAYAAMRAKNQKYIPFQRIMDEVDGHLGMTPQKKGVGSVGSQNVIKGIKGSERQIHDPLESIVANTYKIVGLGRRNQVAKAITSLGSKLPGIIQPFSGEIGQKPVISVLENGVTKKYLVPRDVAEAAKGLNEESINSIIKILSVPTKLVRATATGLNPEFMVPNVARDLQSAFVNTGLNPLRFVSGLAHLIKKDGVYQDFLKSGGMTSSVALDRATLQRTVGDITTSKGIDLKQFKNPLNILQRLGEFSEQPTRIGIFEQARGKGLRQGLSAEEAAVRAANAAQEGTVNFARRGSKTQAANALVAFLNARVQGTDQLLRNVKRNPAGTLTRLALISQAPAVAAYLYNRTFPSYFDDRVVSKTDKQNNFIIMLSDTPIDGLRGAQYIKIPKGDVGKFANPTETFLAHLDGHGENTAIADIAKAFGSLSPVQNIGDAIPTALKPPIEVVANHSFFTGQQIVPDYKKDYPKPYQFTSQTAPYAKLAGQYLNQSPAKIQNLVSGYATGFEKLGAQVINPLVTNANPGLASPKTQQGGDINRVPIVRRFLGGEHKTEAEQQATNDSRTNGLKFKINDIKSGINRGDIPPDVGIKQIQTLLDQSAPAPQVPKGGISLTGKADAAQTATAKPTIPVKGDSAAETTAKLNIQYKGSPVEEVNNKIFFQGGNGDMKTIDLGKFDTPATGFQKYVQAKEKLTTARAIYASPLDDNRKAAIYQKLGVKADDVAYDVQANEGNDVKAQFIADQLSGADPQTFYRTLTDGRKMSVSGTRFVSDGVVDYLVREGILGADDAKALKKIQPGANGISTASVKKGKGKGGATAKQQKATIAAVTSALRKQRTTGFKTPKFTAPKTHRISVTIPRRTATSSSSRLYAKQDIDALIRKYANA